jgi:predicted kinase
MKQALFLMLGYPGSGKSTFATNLARKINAVHLRSDILREWMFKNKAERVDMKNNDFVYGAMDYAAHEVLKAGYSVVYDANNNRINKRSQSSKIAGEFNLETIIIWVQTPIEVAKERELQRQKDPNYLAIPEANYARLVSALQAPTKNEKAILINGLESFNEQYTSFEAQVNTLN